MSTFALVVELELKTGQKDAFLARARQHRETVLANEAGCHRFDLLTPEEDGDTVFLYEVYADQAALETADRVGSPEDAPAFVDECLKTKTKVMGMGHRVYRVRDPRAAALETALDLLPEGGFDPDRLELAKTVERVAERVLSARHPDRPIRANVEFYTAILLEAVGLPREAFPAVFAAGRVAGWLGHVREQSLTGRLIRPKARYIGPVAA